MTIPSAAQRAPARPAGDAASSAIPVGRLDGAFSWISEHPRIVDAVVFGTTTALLILGCLPLLMIGSVPLWALWSIPMIAAGTALRSHPGWATLAIACLALAHALTGHVIVLGDVMIFYALYCANVHGSQAVARAATGAALFGDLVLAAALVITDWIWSGSSIFESALLFAALAAFGTLPIGAVWVIARYQRVRVDQLRLARRSAEQAVLEREQRTRIAVADERARIAREMHDVVAHSLSVIIAQADGGRFIAAQQPDRAAEVLATIGETGRSALADMRGLLGVLRQEGETSFGPQPGLESIEDPVERVRSAGLSVDLTRSGELAGVPQGLSLTSFRIVQEALTNVVKHAGDDASALVRIDRRPGSLQLEIIDDGQGSDADSDGRGHGLTGMAERVALFGGTLRTGPLPSGGFRVSAGFPLPDPRGTP